MKFSISVAALTACFLSTAAIATPTTVTKQLTPRQDSSLPIVTQKGNSFFAGSKRFYLRGVAYQPGGASGAVTEGGASGVADPLLDIESLTRDIEQFKKLGINTIRVYTIDNSKSHDEGMKLLADAGIYVALDANTPTFSLNRENAASLHLSYNDKYLQSLFATIDNFAQYTNLLLLFAGNEVINDATNTNAAPYIKAVVRDMKTYIANRGYRAIPVGYAAADVSDNISAQLDYLNCGADIARTDFFGLNDYSWCDPSSFVGSGWAAKVKKYSQYGAPLFLAEYGCITNQRDWEEVSALYSTQMTGTYSGGLAYEYTLESNGYGLVELQDGEVVPNDDFDRLARAFEATPDPDGDGGARTDATASQCPPASNMWQVANSTLPAPPSNIDRYMTEGAGTGPGLPEDDSSQWGGTTSSTNSYSESWIEMDGSQPTGSTATVSDDGTSNGSNGSNGAVVLCATTSAKLFTVASILALAIL